MNYYAPMRRERAYRAQLAESEIRSHPCGKDGGNLPHAGKRSQLGMAIEEGFVVFCETDFARRSFIFFGGAKVKKHWFTFSR